jgi:hypothetical protein
VVVMSDSAAGAVSAAATPLITRVATSGQPADSSPPAKLAAANTARDSRNTRRRPNRSAMRPPSSRKPP